MANLNGLLFFGIVIVMTEFGLSASHLPVVTVVIRPSDEIFQWPERPDFAPHDAFIVDGDPDQVWDEKEHPVVFMDNSRLLSFYRKGRFISF
ncbi:hypothetical protein ElyMa_006591400 [Elysia marginata]|uniref:Uncharacterized protein n=1 Tax=Elysia marginata TaxID=1093978 RepID=A0AAV4IIZ6_9GAST|nr:hypothetical protein ElyMa_006591400 [Elysia marginata]